jgi:hypothetical protein
MMKCGSVGPGKDDDKRPQELITEPDEFARRYADTVGLARKAFVQHQVLLLRDYVRQNGVGAVEDTMGEVAGCLELVDEIDDACKVRQALLTFSVTQLGDEHVFTLVHMENLANRSQWSYSSILLRFGAEIWAPRIRSRSKLKPHCSSL